MVFIIVDSKTFSCFVKHTLCYIFLITIQLNFCRCYWPCSATSSSVITGLDHDCAASTEPRSQSPQSSSQRSSSVFQTTSCTERVSRPLAMEPTGCARTSLWHLRTGRSTTGRSGSYWKWRPVFYCPGSARCWSERWRLRSLSTGDWRHRVSVSSLSARVNTSEPWPCLSRSFSASSSRNYPRGSSPSSVESTRGSSRRSTHHWVTSGTSWCSRTARLTSSCTASWIGDFAQRFITSSVEDCLIQAKVERHYWDSRRVMVIHNSRDYKEAPIVLYMHGYTIL